MKKIIALAVSVCVLPVFFSCYESKGDNSALLLLASNSSSLSGGSCGSGQTVQIRFTNCTWYSARSYRMTTACGSGTLCGPTWYTSKIFSGSGCLSTDYQSFDAAGKQWAPTTTTGYCSNDSFTFTAGKKYDIQEISSYNFVVNEK